MPTRNSFLLAVALGSAAMCGSLAFMTLLGGITARLVIENEHWSPQMSADVTNGVTLMFGIGLALAVAAVILGVVGWMFSRGQARTAVSTPVSSRRR